MTNSFGQSVPKFRLSSQASQDIDEIWDSVLERSLSADVADKVIAKVYDAIALLGDNPQAGHKREDLTDKPLKFWSVYHYLIVYLPDASPIEIVAVIHGARDLPPILEDR